MNKLTLFLAALALVAGPPDLQAQRGRSRDSLTVVPARSAGSPRAAATRTVSSRVSKPIVVEDARSRGTLARAGGGTGIVRDLPADRPIVGAAGAPSPAYPGGTIGAGPISPTKPTVRPYRPSYTPSYAYNYADRYRDYYYPTYYASSYGYSPYYYGTGYGYSPYYTGYYPTSYYSSYYDSYYGPYSYTSTYEPYYSGYYPASTYSVTGLTGIGSYPAATYPVATYPEPIQTNVTDWTPPAAAPTAYTPTAAYTTRQQAVTETRQAPVTTRRTSQKRMMEMERTIEK